VVQSDGPTPKEWFIIGTSGFVGLLIIYGVISAVQGNFVAFLLLVVLLLPIGGVYGFLMRKYGMFSWHRLMWLSFAVIVWLTALRLLIIILRG
jgi:hypothetical protein